jgi:hypothetical protein
MTLIVWTNLAVSLEDQQTANTFWGESARSDLRGITAVASGAARKLAMYLVKRCCDQTLLEMTKDFGVRRNSIVSWSCRGTYQDDLTNNCTNPMAFFQK